MALKIMLTSLIFMVIFLASIKSHGEDKPADLILCIEAVGFGSSLGVWVVSALFVIWQN